MSKNFSKNLMNFLSGIKNRAKEKVLLKKIRCALKNREFKMHLQFIVDNKTKRIASSEALSRWETPEGEVIMPGKYISLMEKSGLIIKFDYYMFEMVCDKLSKWADTDYKEIAISCNFTRITISEKDFVAKIKDIADKYEFDRNNLIIEITEDSIEKNMDVAKSNIIKMKELGFRIALDDIGSGYTSLISLYEYPIDIVKLDREVLLLSEKESGKKLFLGIISLIQNLNLKVVCEGIETEEQNTLVSESECDYIQGWYYSKARPETEAENFYVEYMKKFQKMNVSY